MSSSKWPFALAFLAAFIPGQVLAGYFPSRPATAKLHLYTGVLKYYSVGNDSGGFALTIGKAETDFWVGVPMSINGSIVRCSDPSPVLAKFGTCKDWPTAIIVGKSVVTATCWSDTTFNPGTTTMFCDEIDSGTVPHNVKRKSSTK